MTRPRVVVVGSINIDTTLVVPRIPTSGDTVVATTRHVGLGGKGANQAAAAAAAGASVRMVGAVGRDKRGDEAIAELASFGVDTTGVVRVEPPTGDAVVMVHERSGENLIVVNSGANERLDVALEALQLRGADIVVCQLEARPDLAAHVLDAAAAAGVVDLLNAAHAGPCARSTALQATHLVVNEVELRALADDRTADDASQLLAWGELSKGSAVATLGACGARWCHGGASGVVRAKPVAVADTTGAGDCFVGWFATCIAAGASLPEAVEQAVEAASLSTTQLGASSSYRARTDD